MEATEGSHHCGHSGHSEHHDHRLHSAHPGLAPNKPYFCPMCLGVESDQPGDCPKCGMRLEPNPAYRWPVNKTVYTCPMHPEIEQDHPGDCPICGMRLEPKTVGAEDSAEHAEIRSLSRKFWIGLAFTVPVLFLAMGHLIPGLHIEKWMPRSVSKWVEFV